MHGYQAHVKGFSPVILRDVPDRSRLWPAETSGHAWICGDPALFRL